MHLCKFSILNHGDCRLYEARKPHHPSYRMIQLVIQLHQVAARILAGVLLKEFALVVRHQLAAQGLLALHLQW
jgi:hypothetical protein